MIRKVFLAACLLWPLPGLAADEMEIPTLGRTHGHGVLPPMAERLPETPLVANLAARGRVPGRHGGDLETIIGRAKDNRLMVVWGYARLAGYNDKFEVVPDILRNLTVEDDRTFTLRLRPGHKWSDGHPFTAEDFRYWWEDVANNEKLAPAGPPVSMMVDGKLPKFEVLDDLTVRYSWDMANPAFLTLLAKARPPFIYRPAHYLKTYHIDYGDTAFIEALTRENRHRNWAALHNSLDNMYKADNPKLPTLQPWANTTRPPANRFIWARNPYYHRVDELGYQLPYLDRVIITVADKKLVAAKTAAGEADLQARSISFGKITLLKKGEDAGNYRTYLWPVVKANHLALYPNLTVSDPVWRTLLRDTRFRRALSLGIDRTMINRVMYFGLGTESQNTVLPESPLFNQEYRDAFARFDPDEANRLLDEIGLTERRPDRIRLLPDGRPLEIIVESAGESVEDIDMLELIKETWSEIGVSVFPKASQRDVLRNRAYSGLTTMSIWFGHDNGVPNPLMPPGEFAPVSQVKFSWPKWGQWYETKGKSGEPVDMDWAKELLQLYHDWYAARTEEERGGIWSRILQIHAQELPSIGIVAGTRQPVVVSRDLRNVPEEALYGWDPGAQFGMHRMDEFWFDRKEGE